METVHGFEGNVVSFTARAATMSFPAISQVDAYWEGLRDGRLMPERAEVDPRGLESALEFAFMMERVAPGVARIRVAGMHLSDLLGMEVRGMPITAFFEPKSRARVAETIDRVTDGAQVADLRLSSRGGIGRPPLTARIILAPLGNGGTGYPRMLGALQSLGSVGRAPRRFAIDQINMRRIIAAAGAYEMPSDPRQPMRELAEEPATFRHAVAKEPKAKQKKTPFLHLVKTDS
ncbi:MAG: PAS domain-containing protein [Rhodobacteraceae bacterium]|nr:PAS domain-containing protein [Paracoccaceae bacterium]